MKHALFAATLVLVAGTAVGCGGGSSDSGTNSPTNASTAAFCQGFLGLSSGLTQAGGTDTTAVAQALKTGATKLAAIGTPSGIPSDARDGFEFLLDEIGKLPDNPSASDLSKLQGDGSGDDVKNVTALGTYAGTTCAGALESSVPTPSLP